VDSSADALATFLTDLQDLMAANVNSNRVFISSLVTAVKIISDDPVRDLIRDGAVITGILTTATRGIPQFKSIERISASMKL
jgi:hypothetical protein